MRITEEKVKRYVVRITVILTMVLIVAVVIFMPFIVDIIYDCKPPISFFEVELSRSDILDYYAQVISLLATIVLGVIAVIQTYRSQKKRTRLMHCN